MISEQLIERSVALQPVLRRTADRADRDRRLPEETISALHESGFFRLLTPKEYGGYEIGLETSLEITGQLSQGCCSTGWVTLLMEACKWLVAHYPEEALKEVFATGPDTRCAGVLAPPVVKRSFNDRRPVPWWCGRDRPRSAGGEHRSGRARRVTTVQSHGDSYNAYGRIPG